MQQKFIKSTNPCTTPSHTPPNHSPLTFPPNENSLSVPVWTSPHPYRNSHSCTAGLLRAKHSNSSYSHDQNIAIASTVRFGVYGTRSRWVVVVVAFFCRLSSSWHTKQNRESEICLVLEKFRNNCWCWWCYWSCGHGLSPRGRDHTIGAA